MIWRTLFFLLVFVNLLIYVWAQGYLGTNLEGREPQRLSQQLHAEKIRIVRDTPEPAAKKDEGACRGVGGLNPTDAATLAKAVEAAGWKAAVSPEMAPNLYLVLIAELANKAAGDKKAAELRQLGIKEFTTVSLDNGKQEIVLGSFDAEVAAKDFLAALNRKGIKSARIDTREQPATKARVAIRAPAEALAKRLPELIGPYVVGAGVSVGDCPAQ